VNVEGNLAFKLSTHLAQIGLDKEEELIHKKEMSLLALQC